MGNGECRVKFNGAAMSTKDFFRPVSAQELPRFAGVPTFMRLPHLTLDDPRIDAVDVGLIGVPWDSGTTNRPGARHGPRQLRDYSTMIRGMNPVTNVWPFELMNCADLGDVGANPVSIERALEGIANFYAELKTRKITPMTAGGDHLITLPILRGLASDGPVGLIQFDSHTDLNDSYFGGCKYTHGTPFRRAIEEGLVDPKRLIQIGIRGTSYGTADVDWGREQGVTIIEIEEFFARGVEDVMAQARKVVGDAPVYCTFDIDFIDASYAPGTGTPEIGGPTSFQAQQVVRLLDGVNLIGADLVEVSPAFDPTGGTGWLGISVLFELLCVLTKSLADHRG